MGALLDLAPYDSPDWARTSRTFRFLWTTVRYPQAALLRLGCEGRDRVPRTGGVVLACNHWSYWDPIIAMGVMPRHVAWLAKKEVYGNALHRWFFDTVGCIPVDRKAGNNAVAVRKALDALKDGRVVGVFPEGTRSRPGALLPAHRGVARLAIRSGCPVLPVGIASDAFWGVGMSAPRFGEPVHVKIGEPVRYDYAPEDADDRDLTAKVAEDVMDRIRRLLDDSLAARARGESWR